LDIVLYLFYFILFYLQKIIASYPESQECPLGGSYGLRGPIGPPYVASRHKRNHSNKGHNIHGHHHHEVGHRRYKIKQFFFVF